MSRHVTFMTIDDAEHYTPQERADIVAAYPEHEREARAGGVPVLGSGRIFPVAENLVACEPFRLPRYWPRLGALDFGWDHPSAAVELAWDTEADVVYVSKAHRGSRQTPAMQAIALKPWGEWLPWAWPRDGRRETLEGAGVALARQYSAHGLNMLAGHARFADGSVSVEAGLMEMLDRMQSGRFKVFSTLLPWFEEFRLYHRKDGQVVKLRDDLMAATRYRKLTLAYVSGAGALPTTANGIWMLFDRAGDKGADGLGSGDFNGPASSATDNILTFASTTGKAGKDSGVAVSSLAPKASPTFSGPVTLGQDPAGALQAATKQYVDSLALNVGRRSRVRVASTANLNLAAPGATIDGVTMAAGYLLLAKNQSVPAENGVYVWNGAAVAASRFSEFDTYDEHPGSLVAVEDGTVNADTLWICTSNDGGALGTTAIAFSGVGLALLDGAVVFSKIAAAAIATSAEYEVGSATGKLLTIDQVNGAMAETALVDAATVAVDLNTGIDFTVTLGGNRTLGNPTNVTVGRRGRIRVVQDATGGRTLTKSSNYKTAGGVGILLSSAANAVDYIDYDCRSATDTRLSISRAWS